jgi:phosphatidylglycerophosphate synthase
MSENGGGSSEAPRPPATYGEAMRALKASQKTSKGAPAYSRFINRRLGRAFAALGYVAGRTPNQITAISAVFTFSGIAVIALVEPTGIISAVVVALLLIGYALDAADGQLARLRGGGSTTGEWLDHTVDSVKLATLHSAVLIGWYRFGDFSDAQLLVPLAFQAATSVLFFAMILTDHLRRARRGITRMILQGEGTSSVLYSLAVAPTDYGVLLLTFSLLWWEDGFFVVYAALAALTVAFLALALPKWYRELRAPAEAGT